MTDPRVIEAWRRAPRLNEFAAFFEATASGIENQPDIAVPNVDRDLLADDLDCLIFADTHRRLWGPFDNHYFASIPFRLEEECRLGAAILAFSQKTWSRTGRASTFYSLGAGAGTLARAIAKLADGRIDTLCCSPTEGNRKAFLEQQGSPYARFHHGPFFELDADRYAHDDNLAPFRQGFDIVMEDTTFQMYGPSREDEIAFVSPRLRDGGLFIQVAKLAHPDPAEYLRRERQKDRDFKSLYFSDAQISSKRRDVLNTMDVNQVDMGSTIAALSKFFTYSIVTWNSGNFYTIISSNSPTALQAFMAVLVKPAIPAPFQYQEMPLGFDRGQPFAVTQRWSWRRAGDLQAKRGERADDVEINTFDAAGSGSSR